MSNKIRRKWSSSSRTFLGLLLILGLFFCLVSSHASAQANLVSATPSDNQTFKDAPAKITLTFSEPLSQDGALLRVVDAVRSRVDRGNVTVTDKQISVDLNQGLAPAVYSVEYIVVSGGDNTTTTGSYNFKLVPGAGNPLDASYLFSTPTDAFGSNWDIYFPLGLVFFVIFLVGAALANFIYFYGKYRFRQNLLNFTVLNRASRNAAIAFSLGLFFYLCRIANLQPFNARFWLYLAGLLLLYFAVQGILWRFRTYPKAKAEWQAILQRRNRKAPEPAAAALPTAKAALVAKNAAVAKAPVAKAVAGKSAPTVISATDFTDHQDGEKVTATASGPVQTQVSVPETIIPSETPRGLSPRGQKRREKKRVRR